MAGATSPESTIDITYGLADGRSIDRVGAILLDGEEIYRLHDVDNQRHPLTETFAAGQTGVTSASQPPLLTSTLGWESGRIESGELGFGAPSTAAPWLGWQNRYNPNGQLFGRDWGVQQAGNASLVSLASEARTFTSDGRAAAHGWQWHNWGTLGSQSHLRGFEYDHRGFITRLVERTGRTDSLVIPNSTSLAGLGLDGGVASQNDWGANFVGNLPHPPPQDGLMTNNIYEWSQHGTLLGQTTEILPLGNPTSQTWTTTRGTGTTNTQTPLMSSVRTSLTAPDPTYDAVAWDTWGRFTSHGGVSFDTIAFDDRPTQVTVDHDDIATPAVAEHATSKRYHDPMGREVLEERTAVGGPVERITKVWVGSRLLVERDDDGWSRTWHQRATDAYPFAYTITCDDTVDTNDCLLPPEWLGGTNSAIAVDADGQVTYALIHNYRGDVIGLLNEQGDIVEQYQYDLHGQLSVRACGTSTTVTPAGAANTRDCTSSAVSPTPGDHASQHGNTLLYAGNHRDPVTGQYRMGARWYSPTLRMFLSRDPAGYAFSFDEWAYTVGDPWNFVDRTGWGSEDSDLNAETREYVEVRMTTGVCGRRQGQCLVLSLAAPDKETLGQGLHDSLEALEAMDTDELRALYRAAFEGDRDGLLALFLMPEHPLNVTGSDEYSSVMDALNAYIEDVTGVSAGEAEVIGHALFNGLFNGGIQGVQGITDPSGVSLVPLIGKSGSVESDNFWGNHDGTAHGLPVTIIHELLHQVFWAADVGGGGNYLVNAGHATIHGLAVSLYENGVASPNPEAIEDGEANRRNSRWDPRVRDAYDQARNFFDGGNARQVRHAIQRNDRREEWSGNILEEEESE